MNKIGIIWQTARKFDLYQWEEWCNCPETAMNALVCCDCSLATAMLMTSHTVSSVAVGDIYVAPKMFLFSFRGKSWF